MKLSKKTTQSSIQQISSESIIVFVSESVNEQVIQISDITLAFKNIMRKLVSGNELFQVEMSFALHMFENAQDIVNKYFSLIDIMHEDYLLYASLQKLIVLELHKIISLVNVNKGRIKQLSNGYSSNSKYSCDSIKELIKDINQVNESFEEISNYSKIWIDSIGGMIKT